MAGKDKLRRRHHIVPRFYLQRFADQRGLLRRIVLPGDVRHSVSVTDATVAKDFYLVEEEDGSRSDRVEQLLGDVETEAADAFRTVVDRQVWPIPDDARLAIACWAAFQILRTTVQRQSGAELADMLFKLQMGAGGKPQLRSMLHKNLNREPTEAEVEELWTKVSDFDSYAVAPHPNSQIKTMLDLMPTAAYTFYERGWTLIRWQRKALATSDHPVVLVADPDRPQWSGVGLRTAGAILVPLDRRAALWMEAPKAADEQLAGTAAVANVYNWLVVGQAHKALFHHPDDDPLAGIDLPQPRGRLMGGYEQVKGFVYPDGMPPIPAGVDFPTS
ncbi:DUF4238 domain-containing protein [Micromonospora sp. NPDC047187]|uniref:DUF4238 domain-containing protein n=1 Tax=Micromonospora sp. NPDC047187 TaxID=3155262 RepID=UPI0033CF5CBC